MSSKVDNTLVVVINPNNTISMNLVVPVQQNNPTSLRIQGQGQFKYASFFQPFGVPFKEKTLLYLGCSK